MKPSDKINEIYSKTIDDQMIPQEYRNLAMLNAIMDYLDEEYEKKQKEEIDDLIQRDIQSNFRSKLL